MSSSSKTAQDSSVTDKRIAAEGEAIVVGGDSSTVTIHQVPDEALEVAGGVIQALSDVTAKALAVREAESESDARALGRDLVRIGLPVAAIAWVLATKGGK